MSSRPPLILSLTPVLRCPKPGCGTIPYGVSADLLVLTCQAIRARRSYERKHQVCGTHWWATRFEAGNIREQVRQQFDGEGTFVELLDALGAPVLIDTPMYWQVCLSGNEQYQFTNRKMLSGIKERSVALVRSLLSLHRRAP